MSEVAPTAGIAAFPTPQNTLSGDSPTHRTHIAQITITKFQTWITALQARRNAVVEKVTRAKTSSKIAKTAKEHKSLDRILKKLDRMLTTLEAETRDCEELMNEARSLIFIASDGEVRIEHTEIKDGTTESTADRGNAEVDAQGPA
jgi:predicted  nucleic acid-binding Zn-ribbon protein